MKERKERQEDKKRDHFNFIKTKIRRFCLDFKKKSIFYLYLKM